MFYIHEIKVAKEHRRKGVGKKLIEKLQHEAARENAVKSFVITNSSNLAACKLYKSTGAKKQIRVMWYSFTKHDRLIFPLSFSPTLRHNIFPRVSL